MENLFTLLDNNKKDFINPENVGLEYKTYIFIRIIKFIN